MVPPAERCSPQPHATKKKPPSRGGERTELRCGAGRGTGGSSGQENVGPSGRSSKGCSSNPRPTAEPSSLFSSTRYPHNMSVKSTIRATNCRSYPPKVANTPTGTSAPGPIGRSSRSAGPLARRRRRLSGQCRRPAGFVLPQAWRQAGGPAETSSGEESKSEINNRRPSAPARRSLVGPKGRCHGPGSRPSALGPGAAKTAPSGLLTRRSAVLRAHDAKPPPSGASPRGGCASAAGAGPKRPGRPARARCFRAGGSRP